MDKVKRVINHLPIIAVLLLSLFAVLPLLGGGFFPIHDNTQIQRVYEMGNALSDGMFPVRWSENLGYGYGYPIFNFYAPLFYYIGGFLTLLGLNALLATKATLVFTMLLPGISMYVLAREFWGKNAAIISSLLYVYAPFHALNAYVRGDFAELLAYGFVPLAIWGVYKTYLEENGKHRWAWMGISSLFISFLIISHNLTALMIAPLLAAEVLVFSILYFKRKKKLPLHVFLALPLGILIASSYWIPALAEMKYADVLSVVGGGSNFRDHFVCLIQFWNSPWGYAGSASGCIDGMSFQLGKFHIAFLLMSVGVLLFLRRARRQWILLAFLLLFIISLFLMTEYSKALWETIPVMKFFQFPWRFLLISSLSASFCAGAVIWVIEKKIVKKEVFLPIVFLGILLVAHYQKFFSSQAINADPSEFYTNEKQIKWTTSKISDEYLPENFKVPENEEDVIGEKIAVDKSAGEVSYLDVRVGEIKADINLNKDTAVRINTAFFPAWHAYLDGEEGMLASSYGVYSLNVSKGRHRLVFSYEQTFIEKLSNLLSVSGVALLFAGIITSRRKNHDKSS